LLYNIKLGCWRLQKCIAYAKFDQEKFDALKVDGKLIVIMQDKEDVQYFAKWRDIASYPSNKLGDAFTSWLASIIDIKLGDRELDVKTILNTFNSIKKCISEVIMMSSIFRIKIDMEPVSANDLDKLINEENMNRDSSVSEKRHIPVGGLVGPETVFAPQILDFGARSTINMYNTHFKDDGTISVEIDESPIKTKGTSLSMFNKDKDVELIKVKKIGELVPVRAIGRKLIGDKVPKKESIIKVDRVDQVIGGNSGGKKRGRPRKVQPVNEDVAVTAVVPPVVPPVDPIVTKPESTSTLKPKVSLLQPKISSLVPKNSLVPKQNASKSN
jgi:hypothetical protein